jgi:hypothetical protein
MTIPAKVISFLQRVLLVLIVTLHYARLGLARTQRWPITATLTFPGLPGQRSMRGMPFDAAVIGALPNEGDEQSAETGVLIGAALAVNDGCSAIEIAGLAAN